MTSSEPAPTDGTAGAPIGVVVVNYASSALVEANLGSVDPAGPLRIVLVDNLSGSAERERVRRLCDRQGWSLVEMAGNRGFGSGVNAGVRRALDLGCRTLLLLNPDARVTGAAVEALRQGVTADPTALLAPQLRAPDGRLVSAGSVLDLTDGRTASLPRVLATRPDPRARPVAWVTAACLALSRTLWEATGGFDESYFLYWEDVDLVFRAVARGGHVVLRDDLTAVHDQGGTQGPRRGRAKSRLYYHYNCRNRLVFAVHHLDRRSLWRWLLATPAVSWEILLRGGRRQLLREPGLLWAAASGAAAGVGLALRAWRQLDGPALRCWPQIGGPGTRRSSRPGQGGAL